DDCGAGRRRVVGHDVHPLSQGLLVGDESAVICFLLYGWGTGDDDRIGSPLPGRVCESLAAAGHGTPPAVLVAGGGLRVGYWRHLPAICSEVHRRKPRNTALQLESVMGAALGSAGIRRIPRLGPLRRHANGIWVRVDGVRPGGNLILGGRKIGVRKMARSRG